MRCAILGCLLVTTAYAEPVDLDAKRRALVDAITARDIAAVERATKFPLRVSDLWFDTEPCKAYAGRRDVAPAELGGLIDCLAELGVHQPVSNKTVTYGPGIPVWLRLEADGRLYNIKALQLAGDVTIEPELFATHIARWSRQVVPDKATKQRLDRAKEVAGVMTSLCVDERGKLDHVDVSSSDIPGYAAAIEKVIRGWKIKPFVVHGKGVRACTMLLLGYPESRLQPLAFPPPPPPPPPPAQPPVAPKP